MRGSCLCGAVGFEFEFSKPAGPFELCHCNRCRKATGSAYAAMLTVPAAGFRIVRGNEYIRTFAAPLLRRPPVYKTWFCSLCGSPLPDPQPDGAIVEIPAGTIDDLTGIRPDKHIYVDLKADWDDIADDIPRFTRDEIATFRYRHGWVTATPASVSDP